MESRQVRRAKNRALLKEMQNMEKRRARKERQKARRNKKQIGTTLPTVQ